MPGAPWLFERPKVPGEGASSPIPASIKLLPLGGDTITDSELVLSKSELASATVVCDTAYTTAGTCTLDLQINGLTVLSGLLDVTSVTALPATTSLTLTSAPLAMAEGDVIRVIVASNNADLAGAGLAIYLPSTGVP